jgi:hypothetical protein
MRRLALLVVVLLALSVAPVSSGGFEDVPNDEGTQVLIWFAPSPSEESGEVDYYLVQRKSRFKVIKVDESGREISPEEFAKNPDLFYELRAVPYEGEYVDIARVKPGSKEFYNLKKGRYELVDPNVEIVPEVYRYFGVFPVTRVRYLTYDYRIYAVGKDGSLSVPFVVKNAHGKGNLFNSNYINVGVISLVLIVVLIFFIFKARMSELYIRPIAGLMVLDEAIGRATEMGRSVMYISGLGAASDIATIAAMNILGRVAKKVADYESSLLIPCYDPIVMNIERQIVKEAYMERGKPDAYRDDSIFYLTSSQFGYAAAVDGLMVREKPATIFYMGTFYAESLILAETGNSVGAIQVAGTDAITQIPFFITACDYTIIGEELYAASAYLSRDPLLLGTLKGQDIGKAILIVVLILAFFINLLGITKLNWFINFFQGR